MNLNVMNLNVCDELKSNIRLNCIVSLVVLSTTATLRGLGFDSQVEQKVLLGFAMELSVAARS